MEKKKITALLLAFVMILPGVVPAVAEGPDAAPEGLVEPEIIAGPIETEAERPGAISFASASDVIAEAMAAVDYSVLTSYDPQSVIMSLDLPASCNGVAISWRSSNKNVITNSGRLIRPKNDEPDASVVMTATFTYTGQSAAKTFHFTVPADEPFIDPSNRPGNPDEHMTDEEFFGKWDGAEWISQGKLDYSLPGLKAVKAAVINGNDYELAKEALLSHMQTRKITAYSGGAPSSRNTHMANAIGANIFPYSASYIASPTDGIVPSGDYTPVTMSIRSPVIARGSYFTFSIIAKHNECSEALIAGGRHPNEAYRPKVVMTVNGEDVEFQSFDSATLRAGKYSDEPQPLAQDLKVKMFGSFLGDETYKAFLKFDFRGLKAEDTISNPRLILHCRLGQGFDDTKRLFAAVEPSTTWSGNTVTWNSQTAYLHNYNGVPGGCTWTLPPRTYDEWFYLTTRFNTSSLIAEYVYYKKDESYAYPAIAMMMDFITDTGGMMTDTEMMKFGGYSWSAYTPEAKRGGYPRQIDAAIRVPQTASILNNLAGSRYMTPDVCTAIMKNLWDMLDTLMYKSTVTAGHNFAQTTVQNCVYAALTYPEFTKSAQWRDDGNRRYVEFMELNFFPDGAYIEKTAEYSTSALSGFVSYKRNMASAGFPVTPEYDEKLKLCAVYDLTFRYPNGLGLQFGDATPGARSLAQMYPDFPRWYSDRMTREIEFIDTFTQRGDEPAWKSIQFPDGRQTMMRSDWSVNSLYLYTQTRGHGLHGHADDNAVMVYAYDRALLIDPGSGPYDAAEDPRRREMLATLSHNTVEVNGKNQTFSQSSTPDTRGDINEWITNDSYDFLSQTTKNNADAAHQRTITFIKPYFWIVSDLLTPKNLSAKNSYKQAWHMHPSANLSTDGADKKILSNYGSGANIIVATADKDDAGLFEASGWYDFDKGKLSPVKYAYYQKADRVGKQTFDTVLIPENGTKGAIDVERIPMGDTSAATALKFNAFQNGREYHVYYYLAHEHSPSAAKTFEKYKTNGKMVTVREDASGNIREIALAGGSMLSYADGTGIIAADGMLTDISLELSGSTLSVTTGKPQSELPDISIRLKNTSVKTVEFNGQTVRFNKDGDQIILSDEPIELPVVKDPKQPSIGGGGTTGPKPENPNPEGPKNPDDAIDNPPKSVFVDIKGHWAEEAIKGLKEKGVLSGTPGGEFQPDSPITRAELLAMATRAANLPEKAYSGGFEDVFSQDWYSGIIEAGLDAGLISKDSLFRPNDSITREEMCKILIGAADLLFAPGKNEWQSWTLPYQDSHAISDWAVDYVRAASYYKLVTGMDDGSFVPLHSATRAQAAAVIARLLAIEE